MKKYFLHHNDLPRAVKFKGPVAVDCEMLGLKVGRDRLCLVQLKDEKGAAHLVKFDGKDYDAPNLRALLENEKILKIFHFGQTDIAFLHYYIGAVTWPLFDTKIASKMARRYTDKHGLNDLCYDLLSIEVNKEKQKSDWGAATLSPAQIQYAISDVLHLHALRDELSKLLQRDGLLEFADVAFDSVANNGLLESTGLNTTALFAHGSEDRV